MELKKTIVCKVSDKITKKKLSYLDKITGRVTYSVNSYVDLFEREYENVKIGSKNISKSKLDKYKIDINLNSGYLQQCRDKATWMYKSYLTHLDKWKKSFDQVCKNYKYFFRKNYSKLKLILKRRSENLSKKDKVLLQTFKRFKLRIGKLYKKGKPEVPLRSKKYISKKIPVVMDKRTCEFVKLENKKLTKYWLSLSSLKKYHKVYIPLFLSDYQINKLKGQQISSVQLVKRDKKYYAHLSYSVNVDINENPQRIKSVDLGINNSAVTVLLPINSKLTKKDIKFYNIKHLKTRIHRLDLKRTEYQRKKLYSKLKKIRNKRRETRLKFDHLISKKIAEDSKNEDIKLIIGDLQGIRNIACRGNYKSKKYRRKLNRWSFGRLSKFIRYKCNNYNIPTEFVSEAYTSRRCHKCGSFDTQRLSQGLFICNIEKSEYNADLNGALNIGLNYYIKNIDPDYRFGLWGAQNTS